MDRGVIFGERSITMNRRKVWILILAICLVSLLACSAESDDRSDSTPTEQEVFPEDTIQAESPIWCASRKKVE